MLTKTHMLHRFTSYLHGKMKKLRLTGERLASHSAFRTQCRYCNVSSHTTAGQPHVKERLTFSSHFPFSGLMKETVQGNYVTSGLIFPREGPNASLLPHPLPTTTTMRHSANRV